MRGGDLIWIFWCSVSGFTRKLFAEQELYNVRAGRHRRVATLIANETSMQTGHKFLLGAVVVGAGLTFLLITGVEQSAARHVTLELLLAPGRTSQMDGGRIQLGGCTVVEGSIRWDEYRHRPAFTVTDGDRVLPVRYTGNAVLPDTFKDRAQVVMEGRYNADGGQFDADVIFAKCPSKYEGESYDDHVDALATGP